MTTDGSGSRKCVEPIEYSWQDHNDNITFTALEAYATSKAWTLTSGNEIGRAHV